MVTLGFTLLSLVLPFFSILNSVTIGLVSLRKDTQLGLILVIASSALVFGVLTVVGQTENLSTILVSWFGHLFLLWLFCSILKISRSLPATLVAIGGTGLLLLVAFWAAVGDPLLWWQNNYKEPFNQVVEAMSVNAGSEMTIRPEYLASVLLGVFVAANIFSVIINMFLSRGWQAAVFNPGGFKQEFFELQFGKKFAIVAFLLLIGALAVSDKIALITSGVVIIIAMLYVFQGMAVLLTLFNYKNWHWAWLIGILFLSLIFGSVLFGHPFLLIFVLLQLTALTGYADTWKDFRQKLQVKS